MEATKLVDRHIGSRLQAMRAAKGLTQKSLGASVGISFQQIQKYEHGNNRISASMLWQFSQVLGVAVSDFFMGLEDDVEPVLRQDILTISDAALKLQNIEDEEVRRHVVALIRAF